MGNKNKAYDPEPDDNPKDRNKVKWNELARNSHVSGVTHRDYMDVKDLATPGDVGVPGGGGFDWRAAARRTLERRRLGLRTSAPAEKARRVVTDTEARTMLDKLQRNNGRRSDRAARILSRILHDPSCPISGGEGKALRKSTGATVFAWRQASRRRKEKKAQKAQDRRRKLWDQ